MARCWPPATRICAPTYLIDAELSFEEREPEHGARVQVHHGTRESPARLAWLGGRVLAGPPRAAAVAVAGRPARDPSDRAARHDRRRHGARPAARVSTALHASCWSAWSGWRGARATTGWPSSGGPAAPRQTPPDPQPLTPSALALEQRLREGRFEPPLDSELDPADLAALRDAGRAVRVTKTLHYHPDVVDEVRERVVALAGRHGGAVTLASYATSSGPRASSHRRCSSISTRSGSRSAAVRPTTCGALSPERQLAGDQKAFENCLVVGCPHVYVPRHRRRRVPGFTSVRRAASPWQPRHLRRQPRDRLARQHRAHPHR